MSISQQRLKEIAGIPDEEIDTSDIPELDDDFWKDARRILPSNYLCVEPDILEWFKAKGQEDYQTRINAVLRNYVEANR